MKYSFTCALFALTTSAYASLPEASISGDATSPSALTSVPNSTPADLDQSAMAENHENHALPDAPRHTGVINVEWKKEGDFSKIKINSNQIRSVSYTSTTPDALVKNLLLVEYKQNNEPVLIVDLYDKYLTSKDFLKKYADSFLLFENPLDTVKLRNDTSSGTIPLDEFLDFLTKNKILSESDADMIANDAAFKIPESEKTKAWNAQFESDSDDEFSGYWDGNVFWYN